MNRIIIICTLILAIFVFTSCNDTESNAYVVSSEMRSVPIIDDKTGQTVGQAYDGFAVSISDVREDKAFFFMNISDPSLPSNHTRMNLYIPVEYMIKAYVEPQDVPAIISLDTIRINSMAGIHVFSQGKQEVIARFHDETGPIQFIQNIENGYIFSLSMNLVYISEQDVQLIKYVD